MMKIQSITSIAHILLLLAGTFLCTCAGIEVLHVGHRIEYSLLKLDANLDQLHHVLSDVDATAKEADAAAKDERTYFEVEIPTLSKQVQATLANANSVLSALRDATVEVRKNEDVLTAHTVETIDATTATIKQVQPVITNANTAVTQLGKLASDPNIPKTLSNVQETSANTAATTHELVGTAKDIREEVHSITHPSWAVKIWHITLDVAHALNPF